MGVNVDVIHVVIAILFGIVWLAATYALRPRRRRHHAGREDWEGNL